MDRVAPTWRETTTQTITDTSLHLARETSTQVRDVDLVVRWIVRWDSLDRSHHRSCLPERWNYTRRRVSLTSWIIKRCVLRPQFLLAVASFGASAVLCYGTIESPLAQPRHLVGGQVLSCILSVAITRLFRKASGYELSNAVIPGELNHVVWINGALNMALSLLLMQITGTVHPP